MIRKLRRRFILIAMASLIGTLTVLCTAIGVGTYCTATNRADRAIRILYENGGEFPAPQESADPSAMGGFQVTPETPFETRYFIARMTSRQEVVSVNIDHIAALDRDTVVESINEIISSADTQGYNGYYRFHVFSNEDGGSTIVVMDCFLQLQSAYHMLRLTLLISLACAAIVLILLLFLSKRAIRPFVENLEKQRQFITDASHELKTPLTILSADLSLMEDSCGENRWLAGAKAQVARLDKLVKTLVELARTEEDIDMEEMLPFCASEVALAVVDVFTPLAEANGKNLTAEIAPDLWLKGVQDNFFRLLSLLLDNAVKYCDDGGTIRISLLPKGGNVCLSVSNPSAGVNPSHLSRWFDRFYRSDSSRARSTGGYGIGLSTAKAIVERHKGKISAHYADGTVTFNILIPRMKN